MADRRTVPGIWKMNIKPVRIAPTSSGDMVLWRTTGSNHEDRTTTCFDDVVAGVSTGHPDFKLNGNVDDILRLRTGDTTSASGSRMEFKSEIFASASVERIALAARHIIACELWEEISGTVDHVQRTNDKELGPIIPLPGDSDDCTEIFFPELEVGGSNERRVIQGVLSVRPYLALEPSATPDSRTPVPLAIHSVLEDDVGRALKIMIFCPHPGNVMQRRYCKGMKLAIRNPVLEIFRNQCLALHVRDAANIFFCRNFVAKTGKTVSSDVVQHRQEEMLEAPSLSPSSQLSTNYDIGFSKLVITDRLLDVGESLYQQRDWVGATAVYSNLIIQTIQRMKVCQLFESQKDERVEVVNFVRAVALEKIRLGHLILQALLERCKIRIDMRCYELALLDAEVASGRMERGPKESLLSFEKGPNLKVESLLLKGTALRGLGRYEEAARNFKSASDLNPSNSKEVVEAIESCNISLQQSRARDDTYDLVGMRLLLPAAPHFREFVDRAVTIQSSVQNLGRGLILTKAVVEGQILVVSNAVALTTKMVPSPSFNDTMDELAALIALRARYSPRIRKQLLSLEQFSGLNSVSGLQVPPRNLFLSESQPGNTQAEQYSDITSNAWLSVLDSEPVDDHMESKIFHNIVLCNVICESAQPDIFPWREKREFKQARYWGIWTLPSFINHSCDPNCFRKRVGDAMFIMSTKDIAAGEELTMPYFTTKESNLRRAEAKARGFTCLCSNCDLYRKSRKNVRKARG